MKTPPAWQLPEGVNASLWEYAHSERLAREEDTYFDGHALLKADAKFLDARLRDPGPLIDLGCGAGRLSIHFAKRGFAVTAIDLSRPMLEAVGVKASAGGVVVRRIEANLCDLRCLPDQSFQYAISMFSTLGMIRGSAPRRKALQEAHRILRPGGRLALHAHNLWLNLRDRQGRGWLIGQFWRSLLYREELGDRRMIYRSIPDMEVHLYRWRELNRELGCVGFRVQEVIPIDAVSAQPIRAAWFAHPIRADGWIVFATRG
jgi:SAM-dependent methyltransferase